MNTKKKQLMKTNNPLLYSHANTDKVLKFIILVIIDQCPLILNLTTQGRF